MKKSIVILSALALLVACAKVAPVIEEPVQEDNQVLKLNINITREGLDDTKASVKSAFADGDVVFAFINGVATPKYLELKYNIPAAPADPYWEGKCKNGMDLGDFDASGTMTTVYLPYGSAYTVADDGEGNFTIKDDETGADYSGHFYNKVGASYAYNSETTTFSATVTLVAAQPLDDDDKLVHFDVTGYTPGNTYVLNQDYMKPMSLSSILASGDVTTTEGKMGAAIPGYKDASFMSFSGVLDATAVNVSKTYRFLIHDKTSGTAYFRQIAADQKISANKYIGIGAISSSGWASVSSPYFSVAPTKIVAFAPGNLVLKINALSDDGVPTDYTWCFHEHQYDALGKFGTNSLNAYLNGDGVFKTVRDIAGDPQEGALITNGMFDLFSCVASNGDLNDRGPLAKYGVSSTKVKTDFGKNDSPGCEIMNDWGENAIQKPGSSDFYPAGTWYNLGNRGTDNNLQWILGPDSDPVPGVNCRISSTVNGVENARFAKVLVHGVKGLLIFPDHYSHPDRVAPISNINTKFIEGWENASSYSYDDWTLMESAGAVFLPCTAFRDGPNVSINDRLAFYRVNDNVQYITSGGGKAPCTYILCFYDSGTGYDYLKIRAGVYHNYYGTGVRLVRDLVPTTISSGSATAEGFDFE